MADESNNGNGTNKETALLEAVGPVLDERFTGTMPETFTTDSGVVLRLRKVSSNLLTEAMRKLKQPRPPMVRNEAKDRDEPNELSPDYLDALEGYQLERAALVNIVYLGRGTTAVSKPDNLLGPDDDWDIELQELLPELTFPEKGTKARYISWLRNYVLNDEDHNKLLMVIQGYYGVLKEATVTDAMASFPSNEERGVDTGPSNPEGFGAAS